MMYEDGKEDGNKDGENEEIKDFLGSGCGRYLGVFETRLACEDGGRVSEFQVVI